MCQSLFRHLERHIPDTSMNEPDQILPWHNVGSNEPVGGAGRHGLSRVLPVLPPQALSQPKEVPPVRSEQPGKPRAHREYSGFLGTQAPLTATSEGRCSESRSKTAPRAHSHSVHLFWCLLSTHSAPGTGDTGDNSRAHARGNSQLTEQRCQGSLGGRGLSAGVLETGGGESRKAAWSW